MRIGCDIDGPLYPWIDDYRSWLVWEHDRNPHELPAPTIWHVYQEWGYTEQEFLDQCRKAVEARQMFLASEPRQDAMDALGRLSDAGHSIHLVTARDFGTPMSETNTIEWLEKWQVPHDTLTFSYDKTVIPTDCFIDDKVENVDALLAVGTDAWLLYDGVAAQLEHPRLIFTWDEFEERVDDHSNSHSWPGLGRV
jgi:5'(3')-deoxyribonucleotidase